MMNEMTPPAPRELLQIERFIQEMMIDRAHPVNDKSHPYHRDYQTAMQDLLDRADSMRQCWINSTQQWYDE